MGDEKAVLTFEALYEILRREKSKEELQPLDSRFFTDVLGYLREKQLLYDESMSKSDIFSIADRDKLSTQLYNIRKLIKELYERRERKILQMALNRSKTDISIVDTTNFQNQERELFNQLVSTLDLFRKGVLHNLLELREPMKVSCQQDEMSAVGNGSCAISSESQFIDSAGNIGTRRIDENGISGAEQNRTGLEIENGEGAASAGISSSAISSAKKTKLVKFCAAVEQFVGSELELYGPFDADAKAYLPCQIADILLGDGRAVEIDED